MPISVARPLWAGRVTALLGILLLALNLRTAVAAISPIVAAVALDVPLGSVALGLLGMLPPIAFAASGLLAPLVARRIGIETTLVLACVAMIAGPLVRATASSFPALALGGVIALAGMGFGNILIPAAVKKYFPDRIGQLTATHATLMAISFAVPPLVATPIAGAAGWRVSVGIWAVLAVGALIPWLALRVQHRREARTARELGLLPQPRAELVGRMHHSRVAVAIALTFTVTALNTYSLFAWLPKLIGDVAGTSPAESGSLLFLYGIVGLPLALLAPLLAVRIRNVGLLIGAAIACFVAGYLGLIIAPTVAPWLWVLLVGCGGITFPLCLALIGLRTRTPETAVALSGFVQSIGYAAGSLGPLVVAVIHDATGGWTMPLAFLLATTLLAAIAAVALATPRFVEDEL